MTRTLIPAFPWEYRGVAFTSRRVRLRGFAQPYLKRSVLPRPLTWTGQGVGAVIDVPANLSPLVCSRIGCYRVGGFEEIEFVLVRQGRGQ